MIPVSLTLKGLYSYQLPQTIEFDRLIHGQLFGIFGAVGSGKSTILEAISFALYGQTERLDNRDNRNYNMMNLKSNELLIDFTFENFDGQLYRYTVKGKRHGKDFEKVNTFDRAGYVWRDGAWHPLESNLAEQVVGLSYDNFRRTIIIPQGKFQEFLQLGHAQRTQMLKEIFQLEKYEFFNQVKNLESKNNSAIDYITGQISTFADLLAENIVEKKKELDELAKVLAIEKQNLEVNSKGLANLSALKLVFENLNAQKEILLTLEQAKGSFDELEVKIREYEYCFTHFKNDLDRLDEKKVGIEVKKRSLAEIHAKLLEVKKEVESLSEPMSLATAEFNKQEEYKEKLLDYRHLVNLVKLKSEVIKFQERIDKGTIVVNEVLKKKLELENKRVLSKRELQEKNSLMPNIRELTEVRAWFDKKVNLEANLAAAIEEANRLDKEVASIEGLLPKLLHEYDLLYEGELSFEHLYKVINGLELDKAEEIKVLVSAIEHLNVQVKLTEFTEALNRGEPCPLCGSLEHAAVLELEDVQLHLHSGQARLKELQLELISFQKLDKELHLLESKSNFISGQILHAVSKVNECRENCSIHRAAFVWPAFDSNDPKQMIDGFYQAEILRDSIARITETIDKEDEELDRLTNEYNRYVDSLDKLKIELQAKITESATLAKQLKQHDSMAVDSYEESVLNTLYEALNAKILSDKSNYEGLSLKLTSLNEQAIKASSYMESIEAALGVEKESLREIQAKLDLELSVSSFDDWGLVKKVLSSSVDWEEGKRRLDVYNKQLYSVKDRLIELNDQAKGQSFDPVKYEEFTLIVAQLNDRITHVNDQLVSGHALYSTWIVQMEAKDKLVLELSKLEHRAENLKTMRQLFIANGFVNYISTVYLQNLCHAANERFYSLTNQQLRLELGDKNEFLVRDFMNDGKLRSVKTLSGGQTFQASLCLALALAESVQQQNHSKQNFFFLDEGFGSLDKEALQMAFETLKALRKENRIVGIISHVEELQQEIDVYLKVTNDSFLGSTIAKSWQLY